MKLIPHDLGEITNCNGYKKTKNFKILDEFFKSGLKCAKIEDYPQKNARSCCESIRHSLKRFRFNGIEAFARGQDVFLVNIGAKEPRLSYKD